jgi:riboflavin synthase
MFTGLVEAVGHVTVVRSTATGAEMTIATSLAADLRLGQSIAVNGVCLTVTGATGDEMQADIGPETARITTLGSLRAGVAVNLERAVRVDSRFGGHFVQGHVDGVGDVLDVRQQGDAHWISVRFPPALAPFIVRKGSLAVDGVSLTVADLGETALDVMIIPFTWEHTNLSGLRAGVHVNLECDMVGKYVARAAELAGRRLDPS